jgi:RNA recognition motif-containing protein
MAKELFVGNMPWSMTEEQMRELFAQYGEVESCVLKVDKFTGRSRGYGFVSYSNDEDADKAVEALNGFEVEYTMVRDGVEETAKRALVVNESRPKEDRPARRFDNDRRGGGFRGGNQRDGGFNRRTQYDDNGFEMSA